jgi:1,4-alpha-glucan branching enzyme
MSDEALARLVSLRHGNPHSVLGAHQTPTDVFVRVFRPEAFRVEIEALGKKHLLKPRPDYPGIFEGRLPTKEIPSYIVHVDYPGGASFTLRDPYTFVPTLGAADLHFVGEGTHRRLWERLGAHPMQHQGVFGTSFAVWAPNAEGVSVVGDFNGWDGRLNPMRSMGQSGLWELFVPDVSEGTRYKYEIHPREGAPFMKADPMAFRTEVPPLTASVVHHLHHYRWNDDEFLERRKKADRSKQPMSIYELHAGSWRVVPEEGNRPMTWRELAPHLAEHVTRLGFTHIELLPISEHPYGGSWGYQVSSYYAPTARFGHPDDFRFFVDTMHAAGIGVIVDWVPGHFPRDAFALAQFDGTALYEHADPRKGAHPDWGTLIFNFGRNEVRNFLIANALFLAEEYHIDGLRVDAVASMLYLDYSRAAGEWVPNRFGGRENEEAILFLRELNEVMRRQHPEVVVMAEESTSWPAVSRPAAQGGLGFTHKWNMGWMHDTLKYFEKDPIHRRWHHHQLTFGLLYAYSEDFVLPLSHDEVVHGKKSMLGKMPGDEWQQFANLRALYAWMWAHPGKKLLFMGGEFGQRQEWSDGRSLDWHLLQQAPHAQLMALVAALNEGYRHEGALFETDFHPQGFQWIQADTADVSVYAFVRRGRNPYREVVCIANLTPEVRHDYRVGVPSGGWWAEILNSDDHRFGGSGVSNAPRKADRRPWDGQPGSLSLTLPPLAVIWLAPVDPPGGLLPTEPRDAS